MLPAPDARLLNDIKMELVKQETNKLCFLNKCPSPDSLPETFIMQSTLMVGVVSIPLIMLLGCSLRVGVSLMAINSPPEAAMAPT